MIGDSSPPTTASGLRHIRRSRGLVKVRVRLMDLGGLPVVDVCSNPGWSASPAGCGLRRPRRARPAGIASATKRPRRAAWWWCRSPALASSGNAAQCRVGDAPVSCPPTDHLLQGRQDAVLVSVNRRWWPRRRGSKIVLREGYRCRSPRRLIIGIGLAGVERGRKRRKPRGSRSPRCAVATRLQRCHRLCSLWRRRAAPLPAASSADAGSAWLRATVKVLASLQW